MLLKDCPVGSVVRLASLCGGKVNRQNWFGTFKVFNDGEENFVIDGDGDKRPYLGNNNAYQFEIVSIPSSIATLTLSGTPPTLILSGTTYTLTPYKAPKLVTIDDVVYVMTEVV